MGKRANEDDITTKSRKKLKLEQDLAVVQLQLKETKAKLDRAMRIIRILSKKRDIPANHMVLRKYEPYDHELEDWIALFYSNPISTFSNSLITCTLNLIDCDVLKHIRSLLRLAFQTREDGMQLRKETFAIDNLVVLRDEIKLKKLYMTRKGSNEDFEAIRTLILATFFKGKEAFLPLSMRKLLDTLNGGPPYDKFLILHHFALMNTRARRQFVTMWYDTICYYDNQQMKQYRKACKKLPHIKDWDQLVSGEGPLELVFNFCPYSNSETEQPRFFRHALEHVLNHCRMVLNKPKKKQRLPQFDYDDGINMLTAVFEESICSFGDLLSNQGLLEGLGPQKFFE